MSGILAILNQDGRPVDQHLLEGLTQSMAYRGPDAQNSRILDAVGLGHAMLRTTFESERETQPASLEGEIWITADARVDARDELLRELTECGGSDLKSATDPELILHAYRAWGRACPDHLLGDFAFVLWDQPRRRLFCARDHFGVKPLLYARVDDTLIVSNTEDTLRLHPGVSNKLDELTIADHLLFEFTQEPDATAFADIRRLPAAHTLVWEQGALSIARYWSVPREETLRFRNQDDYLGAFHEVIGAAVHDRLRSSKVGLSLSGGLDSTTIAATARRVLARTGEQCELRAFTAAFDLPAPDQERVWAAMAADHLNLPIEYTVGDAYPSRFDLSVQDDALEEQRSLSSEPAFEAHSRRINRHTRILLTGYGADPLNRGSSRSYFDTIKKLEFGHLAADLRRTFQEGKRPPLYVRTLWRHWRRKRGRLRSYPPWINKELESRMDLRARWRLVHGAGGIGWSGHNDISSPYWPILFQGSDPGVTRFPIENRHPFFDLRVVKYMLRVPALPWYLQKLLMRKAMQGLLPEAILARPKAFASTHPNDLALSQKDRKWWIDWLDEVPEVARFIDVGRFMEAVDARDKRGTHDIESLTTVLSLARWLRRELETPQPIHSNSVQLKPGRTTRDQ